MALVGGLGRLAAGRLHWRIERINDAFRDPEEGRLPPPGGSSKGDEIDELTAHSVAAIARQKRLIEAYRETSDQVAHEIRTPLMHLDGRLTRALAAGTDEQIKIGRAHVCTPVTNAHLVCRLLLEKQQTQETK